MEFTQQFKAARRVSTPLVAVRTFDAKSTIDTVRGTVKPSDDAPMPPMILWDCTHGMRPLTDTGGQMLSDILNGNEQEVTVDLPSALRLAEACKQDAILFISNAHLFYTEPSVVQGVWNLRDGFKANGNMLVLLISPGAILPAELSNDVLIMDEPLPTLDTLQNIVRETYKYAKLPAPDADTLNSATDALIGLPAFASEQSTAMCLDTKAGKLDMSELWERKRQIIGQTAGLSVWAGKERLSDIGGIANIKDFCTRLMTGKEAPKVIIFLDEIEKAFAGTGTDMSGVKTELTGSMLSWTEDNEIDGVLLLGVPGAAKSALAKALGGEYGIPVINFDLAGMQSSLVGSSGANLRAAQKTVDAISGGKVLMIATCNSVSALPGELLSRFKLGTFFFDAPTVEERAAIWKIYRAKYSVPDTDATPNDNGWTGREIKECAYKAWRMNLKLSEAAQYVVPVTKSSADAIQHLRQSSSGKYLSASKPGLYQYQNNSNETQPSATSFPLVMDGRKMREVN